MTKKSPRKPSPKAKTLTVQRIFDASPKTLWSYWTDPKKFATWFNPAPDLDLVVHKYDVRPGGQIRFDMPQPDGNKNPQEGVFHTLQPFREIVSGAPDKSFLITVRLTPVGRKTRMTVTVIGVPPKFREGARKGWNAGFDKLVGALEDEATAPRAIAATRVFDAPRDLVWRMWTEPDQVAQWWGPDGFTTSIDTMKVRPGGEWTFVMHGPDGRDYPNEIVYLEVVRPERLVYDHGPAPRFRTTVTFADLGKKTRLTMRGVFATAALRNKVAKEFGAVEGMQQTLGRLAEVLANRAPSPNLPREISLTRVFNAPRARVWKAWTDPHEVAKWWGPKGFTAPGIRIDLRVGGAYRLGMRGVGMDGVKRDNWNVGEYREIVPERKLVASMRFADAEGHPVPASHYGLPGDWPEEVLLTVTLEDLPGGKTKMTLRQDGIPEIVAGMTGLGWNESLDKLAASLRAAPRPGAGEKDPLTLTLPSDREILITRILNAPRDRVFRAYTDPEAIPEWWGPRGYETRVDVLDLRPGGRWRFVQHDHEGQEHGFHGEYREIVPPERLVETFEYEGTPGHVIVETITFQALRGGKTQVTVHALYDSKADRDGMIQAGMEWGMREGFERLEELVGAKT